MKMLRLLNRMKKNEHGQAIVIAALGMLILALGIMATVNFGRAIHERIRLQNSADAAAYSLATSEARLYNFISFTNRAQVSHYVSAMSLQSILVTLEFLRTYAGVMLAFAKTLNIYLNPDCGDFPCGTIICIIKEVVLAILDIVGAGEVIRQICNIYNQLVNALEQAFNAYANLVNQLDTIIGKVAIPVFQYLNWGTWALQKLYSGAVTFQAVTAMTDVLAENERNPKTGALEIDLNLVTAMTAIAGGAVNVLGLPNNKMSGLFDALHDPAINTDDYTPSKSHPVSDSVSGGNDEPAIMHRAKIIMTEVANATRYPGFNVDRNNIFPPWLRQISDILPLKIYGQTKMLTRQHPKYMGKRSGNFPRSNSGTGLWESQLAHGDSMTGDAGIHAFGKNFLEWLSYFPVPIVKQSGGNWEEYASIQSAPNSYGKHCGAKQGIKPHKIWICKVSYYVNLKCEKDGKHPWQGVTKYTNFIPTAFPEGYYNDFNQPSTISWAVKSDNMISGNQPYTMKFTHAFGSRTESIDTTVGKEGLLGTGAFKGLNAISRGLAYYHRPGNWSEQPNFFNPFWRARLAPLNKAIGDLFGTKGVGNQIGNFTVDNFVTH